MSLTLLSLIIFATPTYASVLYFKPLGGNIVPNQTFPVEVHLSSKAPESITSVSVYFTYPADKLDIVSVKPGTAFPVNQGHFFKDGTFGMTRDTANGVQGDVVIATIGFRAKMANTTVSLRFADGIKSENVDKSETLDFDWTKNNVANFNILEGTIRTAAVAGTGGTGDGTTTTGQTSVNGLTELPVAGFGSQTSLLITLGVLLTLLGASTLLAQKRFTTSNPKR